MAAATGAYMFVLGTVGKRCIKFFYGTMWAPRGAAALKFNRRVYIYDTNLRSQNAEQLRAHVWSEAGRSLQLPPN